MLIPALSMALQVASPAGEPVQPVLENAATQSAPTSEQVPSAPLPTGQEAASPAPTPPAGPTATATQPGHANGGIVVKGATGPAQGDPAQAINEQSYAAIQAVDDAVVAPVAKVYKKGLPSPVRTGLRNILTNLTEPVVFINFLLQLKPGKAAETLGRFALNTTLGVGGLVDVAKTEPFKLPRRVNGFANTMGYYGIGPGPYMFVPIVGPTTLRDILGLGLDRALLPLAVGSPLTRPEWVFGVGTIKSLDDRVEFDCELTRQHESSNPYNTAREFYLDRRKAEIEALHGREYKPKGYALYEITEACVKTSAQIVPKQEEAPAPAEAPPGPSTP